MTVKISSGTILIRENTLLPAGLALKTEAFLPGWTIVRGIDAAGIARKIQEAHWYFFYLANEMKVIVLGREKPEALRRAAKQILAKRKGQICNSLEITSVASKNFLGIPFLSVAANSRHIQESLYLVPGRETAVKIPAGSPPKTGLEGKERLSLVEAHTRGRATQASGL